jgi:hypothetical protein
MHATNAQPPPFARRQTALCQRPKSDSPRLRRRKTKLRSISPSVALTLLRFAPRQRRMATCCAGGGSGQRTVRFCSGSGTATAWKRPKRAPSAWPTSTFRVSPSKMKRTVKSSRTRSLLLLGVSLERVMNRGVFHRQVPHFQGLMILASFGNDFRKPFRLSAL